MDESHILYAAIIIMNAIDNRSHNDTHMRGWYQGRRDAVIAMLKVCPADRVFVAAKINEMRAKERNLRLEKQRA